MRIFHQGRQFVCLSLKSDGLDRLSHLRVGSYMLSGKHV
jgi:hypothetical protein